MSGKKRYPTISDVAEAANVSRASASRVLSGSDYPVSQTLREKVLAAADSLNYRPDALARGLTKHIRPVIGVVVPSITNPFYSELVEGVKDVSFQEQVGVLLAPTDGSKQRQEQLLNILVEQRVAGLAIALASETEEMIRAFHQSGIYVVAFDQQEQRLPGDCVDVDYREGGRLAAELLLTLGHRRIGMVTAPLTRENRRRVVQGYRDAHAQADVDICEELIMVAESEYKYVRHLYELTVGAELTSRLLELKNPPTAVMAHNDLMAMGVLQKLYEKDIRVPEEMSVIGYDDIAISRMSSRPLTTVHVPKYEMGRWIAQMLLRRIKSDDREQPVRMTLKPELMVRATTAPPAVSVDRQMVFDRRGAL